tara:strand:- start:404 stop:679 length:276 start_codon:yes stop_codon:yes gene_type:complete
MADKTLRKGPLGPLLAAGERRTRLRDMVAESPACFVEADRLEELSARIDESVSDPEAKEAYNAAISAYPTSQTTRFPQVFTRELFSDFTPR